MRNSYYWRQEAFEVWNEIAVEAQEQIGCADFAEWCVLMEKGLRKKAFEALTRFLNHTREWCDEECRTFTVWVMRAVYRRGDAGSFLLTQPLRERLLVPTLTSWIADKPLNAVSHRWLGWLKNDMELLRTSVRCKSTEQIARERFISLALGEIAYSVHELPSGYIGSYEEDTGLLAEADDMANAIQLKELRDFLKEELRTLREVVSSYADYGTSHAQMPFAAWADRSNRVYRVRDHSVPFPPHTWEWLVRHDESEYEQDG